MRGKAVYMWQFRGFKGLVSIAGARASDLVLTVSNQSGREVCSGLTCTNESDDQHLSCDFSPDPKGFYVITVENKHSAPVRFQLLTN